MVKGTMDQFIMSAHNFASEAHQVADVMDAKGRTVKPKKNGRDEFLAARRRQRCLLSGSRHARAAATAMEASFWLAQVVSEDKATACDVLWDGIEFAVQDHASMAVLHGASFPKTLKTGD